METIERRALEWLFSRDTGSSSKSIAKTMLGIGGYIDYPSDEGDLGSCIRLLEHIPEWEPRIPEMASQGRVWQLYVENWSELVKRHKRGDGSAAALMRCLRYQAYQESRIARATGQQEGRDG